MTNATELEQAVIRAAIEVVEAEAAPPLVGVPSRDQPWTQAWAHLAAAVEAYRNGTRAPNEDRQ